MRRAVRLIALLLLPALLCGCWDYRGLDELAIVMGMGIDLTDDGRFRVSSQIVDFSKAIQESAPGAKVVMAEGDTIFEAVRDAKRRLMNKLYIGNIQVVVLSERVAREVGISAAIDWFMRDAESRETVTLVIAQGSTAEEMMKAKGADEPISSLEIDNIITEDSKVSSSTVDMELYQAFDALNCPGSELRLPAFHLIDYEGEPAVEANGVAVFDGNHLSGFLTPEQTKLLLIATGQCHGGVLAVPSREGGPRDISLEIQDSSMKISHFYRGDQLTFRIETETEVFLGESRVEVDALDSAQIEAIEQRAGEMLANGIAALYEEVRQKYSADLFDLGHSLHLTDVRLWKKLEKQWPQMVSTLPLEISCRVSIRNTAFIKKLERMPQ